MNQTQIRVVIADDHPAVRAGIRQFIEEDRQFVVVAEGRDGAEALDLIRSLQPDVAVLDLQMPHLSGVEVIARSRNERLSPKFIILTAYGDDPYVLAALQAGARGYLLKTAGPEELWRAIRLVHEDQCVLDPAVASCVTARLAAEPDAPRLEPLSARELDVLTLAGRGQTNRAIGNRLGISERTVHSHLTNIFAKLGVNTRTEAVLKGLHAGWIRLDDPSV